MQFSFLSLKYDALQPSFETFAVLLQHCSNRLDTFKSVSNVSDLTAAATSWTPSITCFCSAKTTPSALQSTVKMWQHAAKEEPFTQMAAQSKKICRALHRACAGRFVQRFIVEKRYSTTSGGEKIEVKIVPCRIQPMHEQFWNVITVITGNNCHVVFSRMSMSNSNVITEEE